MKKLLLIVLGMGLMGIVACSFHAKQPIDEGYYKKTQGVAWPEKPSNPIEK